MLRRVLFNEGAESREVAFGFYLRLLHLEQDLTFLVFTLSPMDISLEILILPHTQTLL